jgi:hypothetical protein
MNLAIGTLVIVVRTKTGLDGATGTVIGPLEARMSQDVFSHSVGTTTGYKVRLSRLTPWGQELLIVPQCLVPLSPPDADELRDTPAELPAHALV